MTILGGCSGDEEQAAPAAPLAGDSAALPPLEKLDKDPCAVPTSTNCPCSEEGTQIDCGSVHEIRGDYVICSVGVRTCQSGLWSECQAQHLTEEQASARDMTTDGYKLLSLGAAADCNNLCDPECMTFVDNGNNLTVSSNLQASSDGLTLPLVGSGGNCSSITVSPPTKVINVTAIDPTTGAITITPSSDSTVTFNATCGTGVPVQPSWTIDSYDRAQINVNGQLSVFSGIASPINVTATSSQGSQNALVSVNVSIADTASAAFNGQSTFATDTSGTTLYPYKNTVFPLDLKAPLVQWSDSLGSTTQRQVQVALRYPAGSTTPSFWYSSVYASSTSDPHEGTLATGVSSPAWQIPQQIWSAFDRSAAGSATGGEIIIRRYYSGSYHQMTIPVKFATQPLYGTVYYTQYTRRLFKCGNVSNPNTSNQSCTYDPSGSYSLGMTCDVGVAANGTSAQNASIGAIDLSQKAAPNSDPFGGKAACPVCHSVSSNGNVFVSDNQAWLGSAGGKGVNNISLSSSGAPTFTAFGAPDNGLAPTYTGLSDTGASNTAGNAWNDYERTGENSRGFAYAAITPDGSIVLQGPNFWGNTQEYPTLNNTQDASLKGLANATKPYFFVKTAQPGMGVQFATTTALPGYSGTGTLTGTASSLSVDGQTLSVGQSVLVMNEPATKRNGIYVLMTPSGGHWILQRRSDADSAGEMTGQMEVRVSDGTANHGKVFYISSQASGVSITPDTDAITFAQRTYSGLALPTMMVPVFSPDGTKIAYVNGDADTAGGLPATGWRRGLSMMSFNQSTLALSSKVRLVNTWNAVTTGVPIKWPFFENDSRMLLFVETEAGEYCSQTISDHGVTVNTLDGQACFEGSYGSMSPTTRGHWKGTIYSIDTSSSSPTPVKLTNMTNGEDSSDFDRSYQPTALPKTYGGYRWVIFTSTRAYGNQFNQKGTDFTCSAPMLWMAALDDVKATDPSPTTDRSHPAFLVPGQKMLPITTANHYLNERGYLVPTPCKGSGVSCSADAECCSTSSSPAACRAPTNWTPASGPPAKTCASLSGTCSNTGQTCATPADCCNHTDCTNFKCAAPPSYTTASFDRDYTATCPDGYLPDWKALSYYLTTGSNSSIAFSVKTATAPAGLATAPSLALGTSTSDVVSPATPESLDVETVLDNNFVNGRSYLRLDVDLIPSRDGQTAPVLHDWEMYYTCEAAQ